MTLEPIIMLSVPVSVAQDFVADPGGPASAMVAQAVRRALHRRQGRFERSDKTRRNVPKLDGGQ